MRKNLIGQRFGKLVVVADAEDYISSKGKKRRRVVCKCDCGNIKTVLSESLISGHVTSCGCLKRSINSPKRKNLLGKRFGSWTVTGFNPETLKWKVICDCGNTSEEKSYTLTSGKSARCTKCRDKIVGKKNSTHGLSKTRLAKIWSTMKQRCDNPNNQKYHRYGARGIKVCEEWKDFKSFYDWAINNGYKENLTIDRIDNDGNYQPDNCRWADLKQQANNKSDNRLITFNDKTYTLSQWQEITGIKRETISDRLNRGWSVKEALTKPVKIGRNQYSRE